MYSWWSVSQIRGAVVIRRTVVNVSWWRRCQWNCFWFSKATCVPRTVCAPLLEARVLLQVLKGETCWNRTGDCVRGRRHDVSRPRAKFQALILFSVRVCVKIRMLTTNESVLVSCGKLSLRRLHTHDDFHDHKQIFVRIFLLNIS